MIEHIVSDFEKQIYNAYLVALSRANKRPFRPRKNFDDLKDEVYCELKKLGTFFAKNKEVNVQDFFLAPFELHNDTTYQPLDYFNTYNAVQAYTKFQKHKDTSVDKILEYTKMGLAYVYKYCEQNKLTLNRYKSETNKSDIPTWLVHLKEHKINFFTLHTLEIRDELYKLDREWREFYVRDFDELFKKTYTSFSYSQDQKTTLKRIKQAIERKLNIYEKIDI
jgi:hypothetical protein